MNAGTAAKFVVIAAAVPAPVLMFAAAFSPGAPPDPQGADEQVGSTYGPPVTAPASLTFHIPVTSRAVESALPVLRSLTLTDHAPPENETLPGASTIQPLPSKPGAPTCANEPFVAESGIEFPGAYSK